MQKVTVGDVEDVPHFMGANTVRKPLSRAIEGMGFAMTYFELDPGESFSGGLHTHREQEELFYVLSGTATFETRETPDGESESVEVGAGEAIHFEAGDVYQTGRNEGTEGVVGFAVGVPGARHEWEGVEAVVECPDCGKETVHSVVPNEEGQRMPDGDVTIACTECGHEPWTRRVADLVRVETGAGGRLVACVYRTARRIRYSNRWARTTCGSLSDTNRIEPNPVVASAS